MKTGVVLINIGTPSAPTPSAVKKYLSRFLYDKRVITLPTIPRYLLVKGIIAPFRSKKSAQEYKKVWTEKGSPLLYHTASLVSKLQAELGEDYVVRHAMRYSDPDIEQTLLELQKLPLNEIIVVPMYPQNASSTTGSTAEEVFSVTSKWKAIPGITIVPSFFDNRAFISASVKQFDQYNIENYDHIVFSYHGLPQSHIDETYEKPCSHVCNDCVFTNDNYHCYKAQCKETSRLLAQNLNINQEKYSTTFQSRFSKNWIGPFTDVYVKELAKQGKKNILVYCPAFVTDCLETIVEIGMELKKDFIENGGETFDLVPCLNDSDHWAKDLATIVRR